MVDVCTDYKRKNQGLSLFLLLKLKDYDIFSKKREDICHSSQKREYSCSDNRGRVLETGAITGREVVSRNPKTASTTTPDLMFSQNTDKELYVRKLI